MIFFGNFLNDVQNAHSGIAGTSENGKNKGHSRGQDIDVLRIAPQQFAG